jgi:hypothetical protein
VNRARQLGPVTMASTARAARADVEAALDATGWRWSLALSRWLDALLVLEERATW